MAAEPCLGRLVRDGPGGMMTFSSSAGGSDRTSFHLPFRCDKMGLANGLCGVCLERERRTAEKVSAARGMTLGATHPSLLHGRVGEPIPFWSHVFGGAWFNLKMGSGYTLSTDAMVRAKKAVEAIEPSAQLPAAEPMPEGLARRGRKPAASKVKTVVQAKLEFPVAEEMCHESPSIPMAILTPLTITIPVSPASTATPTKKKAAKKVGAGAAAAAKAVATTPMGVALAFVDPTTRAAPVEDIVRIVVKRVEVDGRTLYLDSKKQKLYDMKYKYVGRYDSTAQRIDKTFPDSDVEL